MNLSSNVPKICLSPTVNSQLWDRSIVRSSLWLSVRPMKTGCISVSFAKSLKTAKGYVFVKMAHWIKVGQLCLPWRWQWLPRKRMGKTSFQGQQGLPKWLVVPLEISLIFCTARKQLRSKGLISSRQSLLSTEIGEQSLNCSNLCIRLSTGELSLWQTSRLGQSLCISAEPSVFHSSLLFLIILCCL